MSDIDTNTTVQQSNQPITQSVTYASAAAVSRENGGSGPPSKLRHAVTAVVYADQRAKERRAKTVVVSGLAPSQVDGDALIFQRLCMLEFDVNPTITYTRRLGAAGGDQVRPLLVGLQFIGDVSVIDHIICSMFQGLTPLFAHIRKTIPVKYVSLLQRNVAYGEDVRRTRDHMLNLGIASVLRSSGASVVN